MKRELPKAIPAKDEIELINMAVSVPEITANQSPLIE